VGPFWSSKTKAANAAFFLPQQLRQLGDIRRDPPRLVAREQLASMSALPPKADID